MAKYLIYKFISLEPLNQYMGESCFLRIEKVILLIIQSEYARNWFLVFYKQCIYKANSKTLFIGFVKMKILVFNFLQIEVTKFSIEVTRI